MRKFLRNAIPVLLFYIWFIWTFDGFVSEELYSLSLPDGFLLYHLSVFVSFIFPFLLFCFFLLPAVHLPVIISQILLSLLGRGDLSQTLDGFVGTDLERIIQTCVFVSILFTLTFVSKAPHLLSYLS